MKYFKYFKYLIRHKFFVVIAGFKLNIPIIRLLFHDLSKFLLSEFFPYAEQFYGKYGYAITNKLKKNIDVVFGHEIQKNAICKEKFNIAWLKHQHRNPHHWQYWLLKEDSGKIIALDMPNKYIEEMVADWMGAGRAITGKWEVKEWYKKNKHKIQLSPKTEEIVSTILHCLK